MFSVMKVTSALDPQVYGESKTFSLSYPSVLISFRTNRVNPNSTVGDNPQVRGVALLVTLSSIIMMTMMPMARMMMAMTMIAVILLVTSRSCVIVICVL